MPATSFVKVVCFHAVVGTICGKRGVWQRNHNVDISRQTWPSVRPRPDQVERNGSSVIGWPFAITVLQALQAGERRRTLDMSLSFFFIALQEKIHVHLEPLLLPEVCNKE